METHQRSLLPLLLLALLHVSFASNDCPKSDPNFACYTDYNHNITCVWNNSHALDHPNTECRVEANKTFRKPKDNGRFSYRSCSLKPDASNPSVLSCSMDLKKPSAFQDFEKWDIKLTCDSSSQSLIIEFKPVCSVKLNPSSRPVVNSSTVSWTVDASNPSDFTNFQFQLQWKLEDLSWSDPAVKTVERKCGKACDTQLHPDQLIQDQTYEARTRVMVSDKFISGRWSDWSPTTSWKSQIGTTKPTDVAADMWGMIIAGATVLGVIVVVVALRKSTTTWVVKKIRGPPIPNPATSFLQKNWLSPHFTSESLYFFSKNEEILYVEVTSPLDAVAPCKSEAALLEKIKSESSSGSGSSSFSNPSYSHLCSPPPISSLSAGNLQPCAADSPYGPVATEGGERDDEGSGGKESEIMKLLSEGSKDSGSVQVVSDYEKVEKMQLERTRLQSLDSGVCSSEEVSQESLESDSINVTDSQDEESMDKEEEEEEKHGNMDFKKLFGGSGGALGGGSIQVCSGYERVQKSPGPSSPDSGISSGGEEQVSQEETREEGDKAAGPPSFLFPPAPSFPLPRPMSSLPHQPPKGSDLQSLLSMLEASASTPPWAGACGDGYRPVRQEQS